MKKSKAKNKRRKSMSATWTKLKQGCFKIYIGKKPAQFTLISSKKLGKIAFLLVLFALLLQFLVFFR